MIIGIGACDMHFGVGRKNDLPWPRLPGDLKRFRLLTEGSAVIMGRKTWESLKCKPLSNRVNVIVTRTPDQYITQPNVYFTTQSDLSIYVDFFNQRHVNVFVIGGSHIWDMLAPVMDAFYLTRVLDRYKCDVRLHWRYILQWLPQREMLSQVQTHNGVSYYYEVWTRKMI